MLRYSSTRYYKSMMRY